MTSRGIISPIRTQGRVNVSRAKLTSFCRRNHIKSLALFGSILRDDFGPESDIDVLVEFSEGYTPGFLKLADIEKELSGLFGNRTIDLRTPQDLSRYFRGKVIEDAEFLCR